MKVKLIQKLFQDDPYLSAMDREVGEDDQEDKEDFQIRGTDNLIVVGHVEGVSSTLEVYVYNDVEDALYVHHDIQLPAFPRLGNIFPCDIYPWRHIPMRHLPIGDIYP